MAILKAISNHIIFRFMDSLSSQSMKQFAENLDWGFEVVKLEDSLKTPRWGIVHAVGKDVHNDIQPGMKVLIEELRWTSGYMFEDIQYWRTDNEAIMAIDPDWDVTNELNLVEHAPTKSMW